MKVVNNINKIENKTRIWVGSNGDTYKIIVVIQKKSYWPRVKVRGNSDSKEKIRNKNKKISVHAKVFLCTFLTPTNIFQFKTLCTKQTTGLLVKKYSSITWLE